MLVSRTVAIRLQATSLYHVLLDEKHIPVLLEGGDGHFDVGPGGLDVLPATAAMSAPPRTLRARPAASAIVALCVKNKIFMIRSTWPMVNGSEKGDRSDFEISSRDDHRSKNEPKRPRIERARAL